jgi:hypothetical protein
MRVMHPNRTAAKQNKEVRFVGDVCLRHPEINGLRYTSNNACITCALERVKKYQAQNVEIIKQRTKEYYQANKETRLACTKQWVEKNKEYRSAQKREYAKRVAEQIKAKYKKYYEENYPRMLAKRNKQHADKLLRTPKWLTKDDHWIIEQAYELAAMRTQMFGFPWHVDHKIPLRGKNVSGFHTPINLQVIPGAENLRKTNKFEVTHV